MPTLYGSWQGTPYQARIYCTYSVSYTADHTQAIYDIDFGVQFEGSVSDSSNSWSVSGDCGAASGSNIAYSIPSGGGTKLFRTNETAQEYGDASVSASISGVQAVGGGTISGSFTLESGALAPYFTDGVYSASSITSSGATIGTWAATGNGGTLNNVQLQYNTSASTTGATLVTKGSYGTSHALTGLAPNTTYYVRARVSNSTYGYGAWGAWVSFKTASGLPGAPAESWSFSGISQKSVTVTGISVPDNGGSAVDWIRFRYNTSPTDTGATDYDLGTYIPSHTLDVFTPNTTYYMRLYAHNANGWGPGTAWKSFTTKESGWVNVAGVWKPAVVYVCISPGVWKIAETYVAVAKEGGGVNWKK